MMTRGLAGVDVGSFKVRAFVASAVFASVAGSLTAYYVGFISPSLASFSQSVEHLGSADHLDTHVGTHHCRHDGSQIINSMLGECA